MKQLYFICFLLSLSIQALSQSGKLTGSVRDVETRSPLEMATITVFRTDSSVIAYKLSDKNGLFTLDKLPLRQKLRVSVSYTGYSSHHTFIQQDSAKTDTLHVLLTLNNNDTVVVTAAIPVRMNGDTLEINPAAFKMKEDAVVEELLNQVSGITIWSDGTITVNGKKVKSLLVDGKPFMGSTDPRVATQNLPKTAIDKIQLYQEYDRSKMNQPSQQQKDSVLIMNLKLKEDSKKGYFGKASAGYGTRDRFETDLSFQMYNKKTSAGFGGGFNNINKNIGNLEEMFQNNTYRNYNPNLYNVGRFGTNGINKNHSIGGVFVHNFIESSNSRQNDRITVNYNKSGTNAFVSDNSFQTRTALDNPQFIRDEGNSNSTQNKHDVGFKYIKTNSYNDNLDINGTFSSSLDKDRSFRSVEVRDSANQLQSTNQISSLNSRRSDNELLTFQFAKSNDEDPVQSFNAQVNANRGYSLSNRETESNFLSFTDANKSAYNNRHYTTRNQNLSINANIDYAGFKRLVLGRYNFFGINLILGQWFNYARNTDDAVVTDYDTLAKVHRLNTNLSNHNQRELVEYSPSLSFSKNFFKYTDKFYRSWNVQVKLLEDLKTDKNTSSFDKRNLTRNFQFFRYESSLYYNYSKHEKYYLYSSLYYSKQMLYPSIDQLYTLVDDINAYDIRIGNPTLTNGVQHAANFYTSFNTDNRKSLYAINADLNGQYGLFLDRVTDSIINEKSGKRTYYYVNANRASSLNLNYSFNISRRLGKNNLQLMYGGGFNNGEEPNFIDGVSNLSRTTTLRNEFTLQFTLRSDFVFTAGQKFLRNKTMPSAPGLSTFTNNSSTSKLGIVVNYPAGFSFSSTADHIVNSNIDKPIVLWNAFATYRFLKQQGELKFSAMDLLKKYQNINNSADAYGTTTRISNGLQQYFLLTFAYYPRRFGKKEVKMAPTN